MKPNKTTILLLVLILFSNSFFLQALSNAERYDRVLEKVDTAKNKTWILSFEHEKLPVLNGTWVIKKKATKRIETHLSKPISHVHCNSRLPFEERPFEKEIVISPHGQDFFVFRPLYPASQDTFWDLNKVNKVEYQNFGFKGVIIPEEITYVYSLKLINQIENPALAKELLFKGKLKFESISPGRITGKGFEIEYTPECVGSVRDLIEFEMFRKDEQESLALQ